MRRRVRRVCVCVGMRRGLMKVVLRRGRGRRELTKFEQINAPAGIRGSVLVLKAKAARALSAGFGGVAGIEPKLEAARVRIICQRLHARRKSDGVGLDLVVCVTRGRPAVVNRHSTTRAQQWARVSRWRVRLRGGFRGGGLGHTLHGLTRTLRRAGQWTQRGPWCASAASRSPSTQRCSAGWAAKAGGKVEGRS